MLPRRDLLEGARDPEALEALIQQAEVVLRTYQPAGVPSSQPPSAKRPKSALRL